MKGQIRLTEQGEIISSKYSNPDIGRRNLETLVSASLEATLLASHDVLALTYRSATASQNALLGRQHGLPVLASDVGTFGSQVRDGVDGLLVPPNDKDALVEALRRLADRDYTEQLRAAVRPPDLSGPWANYVGTIEALLRRIDLTLD